VRNANRVRQSMRPPEPTDLSFVLDETHIPSEFLVVNIIGSRCRHLVFTTPEQLSFLSRAKTWYIDGTFYVVGKLLYQLLSVHAYVKSEDNVKQIPLAFAIMSGKKRKDYKKMIILTTLLHLMMI